MNGYKEAKQEVFANNSFGNFVRREIPQAINNLEIFDNGSYLISGSVGQGNWASVPWIGIFYKQITTSATKGIYIVYLLSTDCSRLYLTFNQGCTDFRNSHTKKETINYLRENAEKLSSQIDGRSFLSDENIDLGNDITDLGLFYQKGTIYYKKYDIDQIPEENELIDDLKKMADIYNEYIDLENNRSNDSIWWPSKSEYDPGFTVEQWMEMMSDPDYLEEPWGKILAMFYAEKDGASCTQIGEKYGMDPQSVRASSMQLAQRILLRKNCPVAEKDGKRKMWPILFVGRDTKPGEKGSFIWKLRPELYKALTNVNILKYLNQIREEPGFFNDYGGSGIVITKRPTKNIIGLIKTYISSKGFTYEDGMIENFWLCLKSKPFVILAGTSGTGKTRLVRLFAEAIGAEYRLVPVRPDWSDSSDLLGHYNLNGDFVPGRVLKIILEAQKDPKKPYILCLDEMNLARVEYYLSDFLSVIETRDLKDGKIVSDRLLPFEDYGDIRFPENLYLVGTVNMDETTFPFSKKVLDRANTIEFNTVDLMPAVDVFDDEVLPIETDNDFLKSKYLFLSQCLDEDNREFIESVCKDLEDINQVLKTNNSHVGYRVRDEIVFFMLNNKNADLLSQDEAMDNAVMQKILPRIQGSSVSVKNMLCELFKIFAGDFEGYQTQNNDTASGMFDKLSKGNIRYPKSDAKTAFMVRRFDEDGFTSYWL